MAGPRADEGAASRIRRLPPDLIEQIAAGEVVDRPASVVKELVENSLDAGAERLEIEVEKAGKRLIRVMDDGEGMTSQELHLALERHATSKIGTPDDLTRIGTFGFRGEALPAVAAVSRLELESCRRESNEGWRLVVEGGRVVEDRTVGRAQGTTVTVHRLFYNTPARRKFLRTDVTELRHVIGQVSALALAQLPVAFRLRHNRRELLDLPSSDSARERAARLYSLELAEALVPVAYREGGLAVEGWIETPGRLRQGRGYQFLFVNGRPVTDRALLHAAYRGYRTTIPPGYHPHLFLYLYLDPTRLDVNIHPQKREVRFADGPWVAQVVETAVRRALGEAEVIYAAERTEFLGAPRQVREAGAGGDRLDAQYAMLGSAQRVQERTESDEESLEVEGSPLSYRPLFWQVHHTYILAETKRGVMLIDQHSAHERILYHDLRLVFERGDQRSQRLLFPQPVHLGAAESEIVEEFLSLFRRMGFELEPFGGRAYLLKGVPVLHRRLDAKEAFLEMVADLAERGPIGDLGSADSSQYDRIAKAFACKAAIKAGEPLAPEEMQELCDRLFGTPLPYSDVHGRPTVLHLSLEELHRRFGRR